MPPVSAQSDATLHDIARSKDALQLLVGSEESVVIEVIVGDLQVSEQQMQHTVTRANSVAWVNREAHVLGCVAKHLPQCLGLAVASFAYLVVKYHLSSIPYIYHSLLSARRVCLVRLCSHDP